MKNKFFIILFCLLTFELKGDTNLNLEAKIFKNLRCIVCQGQSIAESNSDFAQTIKIVVRDKISSGKNEQEIYEFLAEKYGEWIIYKPLFSQTNFILWIFPYAFFLAGGIFIFFVLKKRRDTKDN